jgi:hypothetical protein
MPTNLAFIQQQLLGVTSKLIAARVAERVAAVISDPRAKSTEVIRDNGFVHGRVLPVTREHSTK